MGKLLKSHAVGLPGLLEIKNQQGKIFVETR